MDRSITQKIKKREVCPSPPQPLVKYHSKSFFNLFYDLFKY